MVGDKLIKILDRFTMLLYSCFLTTLQLFTYLLTPSHQVRFPIYCPAQGE
jgi:hypothetical protein